MSETKTMCDLGCVYNGLRQFDLWYPIYVRLEGVDCSLDSLRTAPGV
jgi:hypothetical protein